MQPEIQHRIKADKTSIAWFWKQNRFARASKTVCLIWQVSSEMSDKFATHRVLPIQVWFLCCNECVQDHSIPKRYYSILETSSLRKSHLCTFSTVRDFQLGNVVLEKLSLPRATCSLTFVLVVQMTVYKLNTENILLNLDNMITLQRLSLFSRETVICR